MKNNTIDVTSLLLQALSLEILFKDYNNSDLMNELQHQNRDYLEKIIEQNNTIINYLKKGSD
jgi:predicted transposase